MKKETFDNIIEDYRETIRDLKQQVQGAHDLLKSRPKTKHVCLSCKVFESEITKLTKDNESLNNLNATLQHELKELRQPERTKCFCNTDCPNIKTCTINVSPTACEYPNFKFTP